MKTASNLRVAIVGCGYWGRHLVRNFHALGALACVADATPAGRELAARLAPGIEVCADLGEIVDRSDLDAIVLATPAATHAELGRRVLRAGKDLFVEKPLALTLADGQELVKTATAHRRILQVGHVLEYHPAVAVLKRWVADGRLGTLRLLHSRRLNFGRVRTEEDALWSVAPHDLSLMLRLTGRLPLKVSCFASYSLGTPRADFAIAMLRFPGGLDAHIFAGWLHPSKEQRLMLVGDRGMAVFDDAAPGQKLVFFDQRVEPGSSPPALHNGPSQVEPLPADEPLRLECAAFLESLATRRPPLADGESGLRVLAVLEACRHSVARGGSIVSMPAL